MKICRIVIELFEVPKFLVYYFYLISSFFFHRKRIPPSETVARREGKIAAKSFVSDIFLFGWEISNHCSGNSPKSCSLEKAGSSIKMYIFSVGKFIASELDSSNGELHFAITVIRSGANARRDRWGNRFYGEERELVPSPVHDDGDWTCHREKFSPAGSVIVSYLKIVSESSKFSALPKGYSN